MYKLLDEQHNGRIVTILDKPYLVNIGLNGDVKYDFAFMSDYMNPDGKYYGEYDDRGFKYFTRSSVLI